MIASLLSFTYRFTALAELSIISCINNSFLIIPQKTRILGKVDITALSLVIFPHSPPASPQEASCLGFGLRQPQCSVATLARQYQEFFDYGAQGQEQAEEGTGQVSHDVRQSISGCQQHSPRSGARSRLAHCTEDRNIEFRDALLPFDSDSVDCSRADSMFQYHNPSTIEHTLGPSH